MRFIHLFLAGYFVLVIGVVLGLWQSGVLARVAPVWIGIRIMMSVASGKPATIEKAQP